MKTTPSLNPSPQGKETFLPSPLGGEGWVRGILKTIAVKKNSLWTALTILLHPKEFLHLLLYLKVMERDIRHVPVARDSRNMQEPQLVSPAF